jgi:hypothetical protein
MSSRKVDQILKLAESFEKLAVGAGFYVVFRNGTTSDFYGPFADEEAAKKASYFGQPISISDKMPFYMYPFHVESYDENEIQALNNDPAEITNGDCTDAKFHPAHIPMHSSWKELFQGWDRTPEQWWQGKLDGRW